MIIDFLLDNINVDLDGYWTSAETKDYIDEVVASGISLDDYWTSAQTKTYVDEAIADIDLTDIEDHIDTLEEVTSRALNDLNDRVNEISGSTGGSVDLSAYWTSAQTKDYVDTAISGVSVDLSGYYTSGQTDAAIAAATANLVTSGAVETQIDEALSGFTPSGSDFIASLDLNTFWNEKSFYVSIDDINYDALSAFFDYDAEDPDKTPASYVYMVAVNGSDLMVETDNIGLQADIDIDEKSVTITDIPAGQYVMKLWKDTPEHSFVDEPFPVYFGTGEDPNPTYSIMGTDTEEDINITYSGVTYTLPFNRATRIFNKSFQDEGSVFIKRSQEDSGYVWYFEKDVKYLVLVFNGNSMEIRIEYKDEPVRSETITNIWTGTQADYDLIANPDPNTFYVITGTTA